MKIYKLLIINALCLFFFACEKKISQQEFDKKTWKQDPKGCKGERISLLNQLEEIKPKLYGMSEHQIMRTLGKPDKHVLAQRSQKQYIYYIEPSKTCTDSTQASQVLQIRFDAINQAKQILLSIEP